MKAFSNDVPHVAGTCSQASSQNICLQRRGNIGKVLVSVVFLFYPFHVLSRLEAQKLSFLFYQEDNKKQGKDAKFAKSE